MANRTLRPASASKGGSKAASLTPTQLFAAGHLTDAQLEQALEQLYIPNSDGSHDLLVPHRGRISRVHIRQTKQSTYDAHYPFFAVPPPTLEGKEAQAAAGKGANEKRLAEARAVRAEGGQAAAAAKRVGVNKEFFRQLQ